MNTTYFLNLVMGNLFKTQTSPAIPSAYYIGLSSTAPNVSGGNVTEPSNNSTGYARVKLESLSTPTGGVIKNGSAISFEESTSNWGTMTHYVVYDALTGGNLLFYGQLSKSRTIEENTTLVIKANELTLTLSNPTT